jgi:hypothetical protein
MNPTLNELEREARATRALIADLESLTQKFDQTLVRAETERNLHLDKIAAEKAHLAKLKDAASLIVEHLGAAVPAVAEVDEVCEEIVAVIDSPQEPVGSILTNLASDDFEAWKAEKLYVPTWGEMLAPEPEPTFEYVAAAVEQIAAEPPATPDATDEPEMTDEQVERLEEQTAAALAEDVRELETVGADRPARRFNPFANNPFA